MKKILVYAEINILYKINANLDRNEYTPVLTNTDINKLYDFICTNNISILIITRKMLALKYIFLEQVLDKGLTVIFVSSFKEIGLLRNALAYDNFSYLKESDLCALATILEIHSKYNKKVDILNNEVRKLKNKADELKNISKAKVLLINNLNMTENDAHKYIQAIAMNTQKTLLSVSKEIIKEYNK